MPALRSARIPAANYKCTTGRSAVSKAQPCQLTAIVRSVVSGEISHRLASNLYTDGIAIIRVAQLRHKKSRAFDCYTFLPAASENTLDCLIRAALADNFEVVATVALKADMASGFGLHWSLVSKYSLQETHRNILTLFIHTRPLPARSTILFRSGCSTILHALSGETGG